MQSGKFEDYLKERYRDQVNWYDRKSVWNQRMYKALKCTVIVLSFSVPIVVALSYDQSRAVAIALSSIVAVLTAFVAAFKFYENWVNYRTTCESLKREKYYFDFSLGAYGGCPDREALFVERIESLLSREHTTWLASKEEAGKDM